MNERLTDSNSTIIHYHVINHLLVDDLRNFLKIPGSKVKIGIPVPIQSISIVPIIDQVALINKKKLVYKRPA